MTNGISILGAGNMAGAIGARALEGGNAVELIARDEAKATEVAARAVDIRARMALTIDSLDDAEWYDLLSARLSVRATVLDQARQILTELDVPDVGQRAIDLIALLNGLFYDRLIGYGLRGTPADAHNVLSAWLTGIAAKAQKHPK